MVALLHPGRESGQAAVESALVLPLMVLMALSLLQLTLMQQAKLMTEYAAYCAARAGIVWNGHSERMHDAARVALLPTLGRTDTLPGLGRTWTRARLRDETLQQLAWPTKGPVVPAVVNGSGLFGQVRVDTVSPSGDALGRSELDFDEPERAEDVHRQATVLSVRVRYWYELRVPFANWFLFTTWWATHTGVMPGGARGLEHTRGHHTLHPSERAVLWGLATGDISLDAKRGGKHYFIPLTAAYSMRMQSNFYSKWLMHQNPDGEQ